jgi:hypothetical protein
VGKEAGMAIDEQQLETLKVLARELVQKLVDCKRVDRPDIETVKRAVTDFITEADNRVFLLEDGGLMRMTIREARSRHKTDSQIRGLLEYHLEPITDQKAPQLPLVGMK